MPILFGDLYLDNTRMPFVRPLIQWLANFFTSRIRLAQVDSLLRRAELRLEEQLRRISPRRFGDEVSAGAVDRELKFYEEVDKEARLVASAISSWHRYGETGEFPVLRNQYCEPVLLRVRDARRFLAEQHSVPLSWAKRPDRIAAELLIDRWHEYAEKYWKQRWLRASLG